MCVWRGGSWLVGIFVFRWLGTAQAHTFDGPAAALLTSFLVAVVVPLPETLKLKLLDDWNFVTRSQKLLELPRKTTISLILDSYCKHVEPQGPAAQALALEVTSGLKVRVSAWVCATRVQGAARRRCDWTRSLPCPWRSVP